MTEGRRRRPGYGGEGGGRNPSPPIVPFHSLASRKPTSRMVRTKMNLTTIYLDGDPRDFLTFREGSGGTIEIYDIAVGSDRRRGKGTRLVQDVLNHRLPPGTKTLWAMTRMSNQIAQQFYERLGFRVAGILRNFYDKPDAADAVVFAYDVRIDPGPEPTQESTNESR